VTPRIRVRREGRFDVSYGFGARVYTDSGTVAEVMHSGSGDDGHTGIVRTLRSGETFIVLSNAGMRDGATWSSVVGQRIAPRP
jgi:hypothetical protein